MNLWLLTPMREKHFHILHAGLRGLYNELSSDAEASSPPSSLPLPTEIKERIINDENLVDFVRFIDDHDKTTLHAAMEYTSPIEVIEFLVKTFPDAAGMVDRFGRTPLHVGMKQASMEAIDIVLRAHPKSTEICDIRGLTPLHHAVKCLRTDHQEREVSVQILRMLLEVYPEATSVRDEKGRTPLHIAMDRPSHMEIIGILLDVNPAAAEVQDIFGWTPLHYGMEKSSPQVECILALLETFPLAAEIQNKEGCTPLLLGTRNNPIFPGDAVRCLAMNHPKAAEIIDRKGNTPLHLSMKRDTPASVIDALVRAYPKACQMKNNKGRTPLHVAMEFQCPIDAIQIVVQAYPGAIESMDNKRWTPLHVGMASGVSVDAIRLLLESHSKVAAMTDNSLGQTIQGMLGRTPLHVGLEHNRVSVDTIQVLLDFYPKAVEMKGPNGRTLLHAGMASGASMTALQIILHSYPEVAKVRDNEGHLPLHLASIESPLDAIELVLNAYPEATEETDKGGGTPLFRFVQRLYMGSNTSKRSRSSGSSVSTNTTTASNEIDRRREEHNNLHNNPSVTATTSNSGNNNLTIDSIRASTNAVRSIFDACWDAAKVVDLCGVSAISILIAQLSHATCLDRLIQEDTCLCLKYMLESFRDGRPLESLCNLENPVSVHAFFSLFDESSGLFNRVSGSSSQSLLENLSNFLRVDSTSLVVDEAILVHLENQSSTGFIPVIDLNRETVPGWTILEILADIDTKHSCQMLYQIVERQRNKLHDEEDANGGGDRGTWLSIECNDALKLKIILYSIRPVTEDIMRKVADRAMLSHSSEKVRKWGQEYGRFLRRYLIDKRSDPKHISETCVVVFGTEARTTIEDGKVREVKVALKFMNDKSAFQREIEKRRTILQYLQQKRMSKNRSSNTDKQNTRPAAMTDAPPYVVPIQACYVTRSSMTDNEIDGISNDVSRIGGMELEVVDLESELKSYTKIRLKASRTTYRSKSLHYVLVMDCGSGLDLHDMIVHQNIAGKDLPLVISIAKGIAHCLQFLNETCGIIHGDVKSRNFIAWGVGIDFAAIDLDNAASIADHEFAANKQTSSGYIPPEQAAVEVFHRAQAASSATASCNHSTSTTTTAASVVWDAAEKEVTRLYEAIIIASSSKNMKDVIYLSTLLEKAQEQLELLKNSTPSPPPSVVATAKYDMWCFGVLLYYMCTGMQLMNVNTAEEVNDDELGQLKNWDDTLKHSKLRNVPKGWPKNLIGHLLCRDPQHRPRSWSYIIDELDNQIQIEKAEDDEEDRKNKSSSNNYIKIALLQRVEEKLDTVAIEVQSLRKELNEAQQNLLRGMLSMKSVPIPPLWILVKDEYRGKFASKRSSWCLRDKFKLYILCQLTGRCCHEPIKLYFPKKDSKDVLRCASALIKTTLLVLKIGTTIGRAYGIPLPTRVPVLDDFCDVMSQKEDVVSVRNSDKMFENFDEMIGQFEELEGKTSRTNLSNIGTDRMMNILSDWRQRNDECGLETCGQLRKILNRGRSDDRQYTDNDIVKLAGLEQRIHCDNGSCIWIENCVEANEEAEKLGYLRALNR